MRRFLSIVLALGLILGFSLVTAVPALAQPVVWVDDDAPNDPGPNNPLISDPLEDGSPDHPYDEIQEGIDDVDMGGTVHVADGVYTENIVISTDGIQLLGAGANVTTINGSSGPVVTTYGLSSTTLIDGFTVTGGDASYGGGMYNYGYSSPIVSNCVFDSNHADTRGGGMYNLDHSSPLVVNCVFSNNDSGDQGGGIGCRTYSNPTIVNCLIVGNAAVTGGGILSWSTPSPIITNCTIAGNTASNGGGVYINGASPVLTNNIIAYNTATAGTGGIYVNTGATPYIDYNDVYNPTEGDYGGVAAAGTHDISLDPVFVGGGDYHLQASSNCIDFGDNTAVPADTADLDDDGDILEPIPYDFEDDPRFFDGNGDTIATVDMGADEFFINTPPNDPTNLGPMEYTDGSTVADDTPTLTFYQSDLDATDTVQYTIQINNSPDFSSPMINYTSELLAQGDASFTVGQAEGSGTYSAGLEGQTLPDDDYYWRVMSTDQHSATSLWTYAGTPAFELDTSPPPPPPGGTVGGEVYPIDKAALLLPWLGLGLALILAAGGLILVRRRAR
jgi:hypothetical protein